MYEDVIAYIMQDLQADPAAARANALRGQMPPAGPPGGGPQGMPPPGMPAGGAAPPMPVPVQAAQQPPGPLAGPGAPMGAPGPGQPRPGPARALPQALAASADPLLAREEELQRRQQEALAEIDRLNKPPDRSGMEAAYKARAGQGPQHLLMALAAQNAGPEYQPMQAHFLKQATGATEPMKMTGGTMTPEGFIEDPGHVQDLATKRADAKLRALDAALQNNLTAQERRRLEAEKITASNERQQAMFAQQQMMAGLQHGYRLNEKAATAQAAAGKLSAKEQSDLDEHNAMSSGLSSAIASLRGVKSDFGTGWTAGFAQNWFPGGEALVAKVRDKDVKDAVQQLTYVTDGIRHGRFGSALTATEKASAAQYLPSEYDDVARMVEKAEGLQGLIDKNNRRLRAKAGMTVDSGATGDWGQPQPAAAPKAAPAAPAAGKGLPAGWTVKTMPGG